MTPYVAQPTKRVEAAQKWMVAHLRKEGGSTARDLLDATRRQVHVRDWEAREAMSRAMSRGDIRLQPDWKIVPVP
jgi:hypothetical protein